MTEKTVSVPAISCGHCVKTIEREVGELPGVDGVSSDLASCRVTVRWDESRTSWDEVDALLDEIGYPAEK
ncbi:heavy-metal-associated domain-containing protein [Gaopeijia maritima]|uniref:Heavy-metal-associated domain-containing protein n=1 Tax=Gaopeijia maritima TaxID=3119007 RepID=A0ABU9ED05_9BACT